MKHPVYTLTILTFEHYEQIGYRKDELYIGLVDLAEKLEAPPGVMKVLNSAKMPTGEQIEFVATTMAQRAVDRHFEF